MRILLLIFLCLLLHTSCNKLLEIDPPKDKFVNDVVFQSDASVTSVALNIYNTINFEGTNGPLFGIYVDELEYTGTNVDTKSFAASTLTSTTGFLYTLWKNLYFSIYQCNALLEGIQPSRSISDSIRNRCEGEAYFFRAFSYFYLVNIWGEVPLFSTTDLSVTSNQSRAPVDMVYRQVLSDLENAKQRLLFSYVNEELTRVNKFAVIAMLARVHLYLGNWQRAAEEASVLLKESKFFPLPNVNLVYLKNSKEAIFQFWNQNGFTPIGVQYIPSSVTTRPNYVASKVLLESFTNGDQRISSWFKSANIAGEVFSYPFKYKQRTTAIGQSIEYINVLRIGEQVLIRAEAMTQLGNIESAIEDLNMLRKRAGLTDLEVGGLSKENLLDSILNERQKELCFEGFHRFFDLKRMGIINETLKPLKPTWEKKAIVFPIPMDEISRNPNITQNKDYE